MHCCSSSSSAPYSPPPLRWQLFDLSRDRGERQDLSAQQPETLERLKRAWQDYARRVGVVAPPMTAQTP